MTRLDTAFSHPSHRHLNQDSAANTHTVSVWDPTQRPSPPLRSVSVRTLAPLEHSEQPTQAQPAQRPRRVQQRWEALRTYAVGALIGSVLVAGTLHLSAEEDPMSQPGYLTSVTMEAAK